jgi:hypothetical protein
MNFNLLIISQTPKDYNRKTLSKKGGQEKAKMEAKK